MLMAVADQVASQLYVVIMTAGQLESAKVALTKALEKLNSTLAQTKGVFFSGKDDYDMMDLYAFPHISRLFYLKDSAANHIYEQF